MGGWRCLVCGYLHTKEEVPEKCPGCGADPSQFAPPGKCFTTFILDIVRSFFPHPILVHFSNGLIPIAALFLAIYYIFCIPSFEKAAFYMMVIAVASTPIALATGYLDWKKRYFGRKLPVFRIKLQLAVALCIVGFAALLARASLPVELPARLPPLFHIYAGLVFLTLPLAVVLGHFGGKLVFAWKKPINEN